MAIEKKFLTREELQSLANESPFIKHCRMEVTEIDADKGFVEMKMPMITELARDAEATQFHGGPVASFIDTAGDFAIALMVGGGVPTINFRVDYIRPSGGKYLIAKATARRVGRTISVADVDIFDDQGRLTAVGRGSYSTRVG